MSISRSPKETAAIGAQFARAAAVGDVFGLMGDLGAGKTQFVKGFVASLGSNSDVTSPTFTIIHEYSGGRLPVYHFDFYRLDSPTAVLRLDFDEYVDSDGICVIEWADRFPELLPARTKWISLAIQGENERVIEEKGP